MDATQPRLFRLAFEDIVIMAHHHGRDGWSLRVGCRRQDEAWSEAQHESYEQLATAELVDAIDASLFTILGL